MLAWLFFVNYPSGVSAFGAFGGLRGQAARLAAADLPHMSPNRQNSEIAVYPDT